jgi:hypothetical protein
MTKSRIPEERFRATWGGLRIGMWSLGFGMYVVLSATGCAARAAALPDGPPLEVPSPPERVIVPVEEAPVAAAPVPETPPAAAAPPRPAPVARPAPPAPAPAAPAAPPPTAAAPASPPRDLRPALSPNTATEGSVRDLLARAARDINQVNYNRLSSEGRAQYDQSKRFSIQAEQALRERNLVFAATLADKAATLAAELLGR